MANLQVNIDIPEEDFKNLCIGQINDLPKDKMEELLLKAVEVALIADKNNPYYSTDSSILVKSDKNGYGTIRWAPTDLMKEIMKEINVNGYLEPIAKEVADYIEKNYKEMVKEYIVEAFTKMLFENETRWNVERFINYSVNSR